MGAELRVDDDLLTKFTELWDSPADVVTQPGARLSGIPRLRSTASYSTETLLRRQKPLLLRSCAGASKSSSDIPPGSHRAL